MSKVVERRGQSLLEVLISIFFMGAILLMSLNFMAAGIRGNSRGREMSAAAYLAQEILETMKTMDFDDLSDFDGFITGGGLPAREPVRTICSEWEENVRGDLPQGLGEIDVQVTGSRARISVVVKWVDGVNKERQVKYETLIANRA